MNPNDPNTAPIAPAPQPTAPAVNPSNPEAYLDAISDHTPTKTPFLSGKMLKLVIGVAAALVLVLIISAVVNNFSRARSAEITKLGTKLDNLQGVLQYGQSNLMNNNGTTKITVEIDLVAASRRNELSEIYAISDASSSSVNIHNLPIVDELDAAKARGNLDNAYFTALREHLVDACSQLNILYDAAKTDAQRTVLTKTYNEFQELANRLPISN